MDSAPGARPLRRWLAGVIGVATIALAGPAGNVVTLGCHLFLGSICGRSPYRSRGSAEIGFGVAVLTGGCLLVGWAIGASRRPRPDLSKTVRMLFTVRWAVLPAAITACVLAAACRNPAPTTELVVTLENVPAGHTASTILTQVVRPSRTSWYRQSWDFLLGLPASDYDRPNQHSQERESRFLLVSPGASLERWRQGPFTVGVSWEQPSKPAGIIQIDFVQRENPEAPTEYRVRVKDAHKCPNRDPEQGACFWMGDLGYRDGAPSVHLKVDLSGG
jgi:hypothetical protein